MHFVFFANPAESAVVNKAQQFGLHARRHFTDFIEQYRTAVCLLEEALLAFQRIGVSARRMAEQLAFRYVVRQSGTV
ncbi:hypothetical protein D3C86_2105350 [compost metagenome]